MNSSPGVNSPPRTGDLVEVQCLQSALLSLNLLPLAWGLSPGAPGCRCSIGDSGLGATSREWMTYKCLSYAESDLLVVAVWGVGLKKILRPIRAH